MIVSTLTLAVLSSNGDTNAKAALLAKQKLNIAKKECQVYYNPNTDTFKIKLV